MIQGIQTLYYFAYIYYTCNALAFVSKPSRYYSKLKQSDATTHRLDLHDQLEAPRRPRGHTLAQDVIDAQNDNDTEVAVRSMFEEHGMEFTDASLIADMVKLVEQVDTWTMSRVGAPCYWDKTRTDCAKCNPGGCQCRQAFQNQCAQCGSERLMCGKESTLPKARSLMRVHGDAMQNQSSDELSKGASAALSQTGFALVQALKDKVQMEVFVRRVIDKYNASIIDEGGLAGILPFYAALSGLAGILPFYAELTGAKEPVYSDLVYELVTATWLYGFQDCSKVTLDEDGYNAIADMEDDDQMRGFIRRVILAHGGKAARGEANLGRVVLHDDESFSSMAPEYSGTSSRKSYAALLQELRSASWLKHFKHDEVRTLEDDKYILSQASSKCDGCEHNKSQPLLFIGVHSAPENWKRRIEVRNSWMKDAIFQGKNPIATAKFIIGNTDKEWLNFDMQEENAVYGDIQFLDVSESYAELPAKSVTFFRWFAQTFCCSERPRYWNVMKLDDDSWPNLNMLLPHLDKIKRNPSTLNYIGGMLWNGPVLRKGKWAETASEKLFPLNKYPTYAAGAGYIMSMDLARKFDEIVGETGIKLLRNEDTTIGTWIHEQNHLTMSVNYHEVEFQEYGCSDNKLILMQLCPGEMRCMWEKRLAGVARGPNMSVDMCCDGPQYGSPDGCVKGSNEKSAGMGLLRLQNKEEDQQEEAGHRIQLVRTPRQEALQINEQDQQAKAEAEALVAAHLAKAEQAAEAAVVRRREEVEDNLADDASRLWTMRLVQIKNRMADDA